MEQRVSGPLSLRRTGTLQPLLSQKRIRWCSVAWKGPVLDRDVAPEGWTCPTPEIWGYVSLRSKRNVTGVIQLKVLKGLSWIFRVGWMYNHKDLHEGEAQGSGPEKMWPQKQKSDCFKEGATAKKGKQLLESGKGKEADSSLGLPEGMQPCQHLDFRTWFLSREIN